MASSARIRARTTYTRADGTSQVYLQVIIARVVKWLPLDLHWPLKHFDQAAGRALPRRRGNKEADDLNLQAGQELARATNIFVEWRLRGQLKKKQEQLEKEVKPFALPAEQYKKQYPRHVRAVDVALFGRMLADNPAENVDAAC